MYIYHKQCEIKQKKFFIETAQTANFTDFPLILCGNGPKGTKTMQTQTLFSRIGTVCHRNADVQGFLKMWWFLLLEFLSLSYGWLELGQI